MIMHLWGTQVSDDPLALVEVVRDPLEVVIADVVVEPHGGLVERQEPAIERGNGLPRHGMRVQYTVQVAACHVDRAVDDEAGPVHPVGRLVEDIPVHVDLDEARRRDLLVQESVRVDQELVFGAWNAQRDVIVDEIRPAMLRDQPVGGRELDARLPLLLADPLAYGRRFDCIADCHAILQSSTTFLSITRLYRRSGERSIVRGVFVLVGYSPAQRPIVEREITWNCPPRRTLRSGLPTARE